MQAIILAGGFGTRLKSVVADVPKPMAPIGNKPFLSYLIDYLRSQGVNKVVLSVHHMREQIQSYFSSEYHGVSIAYAVEERPLGTGGAIVNSLKYIDTDEPVFVLNGDSFLQLDYKRMLKQHRASEPLITMVLRKTTDCSRYGAVTVENNHVVSFTDKGRREPGLISTGVYMFSKSLFQNAYLPEAFSFETDFLQKKVKEISPYAFMTEDYFVDIGVPEDYSRAITDLQL